MKIYFTITNIFNLELKKTVITEKKNVLFIEKHIQKML